MASKEILGLNWYVQHRKHVESLIEEAKEAYPPSAEDEKKPELWKPEHWKWLKQNLK